MPGLLEILTNNLFRKRQPEYQHLWRPTNAPLGSVDEFTNVYDKGRAAGARRDMAFEDWVSSAEQGDAEGRQRARGEGIGRADEMEDVMDQLRLRLRESDHLPQLLRQRAQKNFDERFSNEAVGRQELFERLGVEGQ